MYCKPTLASSFTPLQTYKVLKPSAYDPTYSISFTPLQTYKVLKPKKRKSPTFCVLHHYKLTRFSNVPAVHGTANKFYTITNLQGSQTLMMQELPVKSFTPLQTYKVLKHTMAVNGDSDSFTPLQTYKVLKRSNHLLH